MRADEWLDTACFRQPGSYSVGNELRVNPKMRSDNDATGDMTLNKYFELTHGERFKSGTEFFDIFHHPQFGLVDADLPSPGCGRVRTRRIFLVQCSSRGESPSDVVDGRHSPSGGACGDDLAAGIWSVGRNAGAWPSAGGLVRMRGYGFSTRE